MLKKLKFAATFAVLTILVACGGGGGDDTPALYGAIAVNPNSVLTMGITSNQTSESDARFRAETNCGPGCVTQKIFTSPNKCGSIAYDSGQRVSAWGVGSTSNEAENAALLSCRNGGGNFCSLYASRCNDR
jgi:hypothetical protein